MPSPRTQQAIARLADLTPRQITQQRDQMATEVTALNTQRDELSGSVNRLEARLAELGRHLAETATAIEIEQAPVLLEQRNVSMRLGLVHPVVTDVTENPALHLTTKSNRGSFTDRPMAISFQLASRN